MLISLSLRLASWNRSDEGGTSFADMLLDTDISNPAVINQIQATFVEGTTGTVADSGKMFVDLGGDGEEVIHYGNATAVDNDTYLFTNLTPFNPTQVHAVGASVKVVNNSELVVGPDADINTLPVFQVADVRILDPITLEPLGDLIPETTVDGREPGWRISKTNRYDLLSARETKTIILDEKRDADGNVGITGVLASVANETIGSTDYSLMTVDEDLSGYEGREITFTYGTTTLTRTILRVSYNGEEILLSGEALGIINDISYSIDDNFADYAEYPVRISFYTNTELAEAQEFLDTNKKRIVAGDTLARMFLPVFLDFTLRYKGNGAASEIRANINEVLKTSSGDAIGESVGAQFDYSDLVNAAYVDGLANYVQTPFQVRVRRLQTDGTEIVQYVNPGPNTVNNLAVRVAPDVTEQAAYGSHRGGTNVFEDSSAPFETSDVGRIIWIQGVGLTTILSRTSATEVVVDTIFMSMGTGVAWSFTASFIETTLPASVTEFTIPDTGQLMLGGFTSNQETVEYMAVVRSGDNQTFILKPGHGIHFEHEVDEPLRVAVEDYDDDNVIVDGVITNEREYRPFLGQAAVEKLS